MTKKILQKLYFELLRIRAIEEKIVELYPLGEMRCPVHLSIGQEAVAVGVAACLKKTDLVLSNHRAHGHYLAKRGDLNTFFGELYGKAIGCSKGRGGSMHLIDLAVSFLGSTPIVGNIVPVATGVAFAQKFKNSKRITVVFIGDAVVEEGVFHESINFAVLHNLPIVYVCENNFYSVYTHIKDRQPKRKITNLVAGHGIKTFSGYGNDVIDVYKVTQKAISVIGKGNGPVFLEFTTYRWREHCGPNFDNHIGYRTNKEFLKWKKHDPLELCARFLKDKNLWDEVWTDKIKKQIDTEIEKSVNIAKKGETYLPVSINDVYA